MSGNRGDLHRLVDGLDEQLLADAAALLRALQPATFGADPAAAPTIDERCLRQRPARHRHPIRRDSA